jgi:translation initiation factor IF-2
MPTLPTGKPPVLPAAGRGLKPPETPNAPQPPAAPGAPAAPRLPEAPPEVKAPEAPPAAPRPGTMAPRPAPLGGGIRTDRHRQPPRAPTHRVTPPPPGQPKPQPKPEERRPQPVGGVKKLGDIPKALEGQGPINIQRILEHQREASRGISAGAPAEVVDDEEEIGGKKGVRGGVKKLGELPGRADRHKERQARQEKRKAHGDTALKVKSSTDLLEDDEPTTRIRKPRLHPKLKKQLPTEKRKGKVPLELPVTVRSFCEAVGVVKGQVLFKLKDRLPEVTINTILNTDLVEELALEQGVELEIKKPPDAEEQVLEAAKKPDKPEDLQPRAPVVTIMGHVDHGKTSLLDKIRGSHVVDTEAGGITQVLRAWRVDHNGHPITFLDTPGHEAFTKMRARGANVTDIAVIVVAVDDGVMPQTEEAINHAKAAGVSMIVALNKIDLPNANLNKTQQQLYGLGVLPDNMGGDTPFVQTSAATGKGIDELLDAISLVAELRELKANPNRPATGTCLEAYKSEGEGVLATLLVQNGTLRRGDVILCGPASGRVRAMYGDRGQPLQEAGPSVPVRITGLDQVPNADDPFYVVDDLATAAEIAEKRAWRLQEAALAPRRTISLETLSEAKITELKIILKAEARGSIEAIRKELEKLVHPEVRVRVLEAAIGAITVNDVWLALTSPQDTLILGFNVVPDEAAQALADERGVQIRQYNIIYNLTDDVRSALEGKLKPREEVVHLGRAVVRETFKISRVGTIAGCYVTSGVIERAAKVRVIRSGVVVYPPADRSVGLESLKRFKEDVREVREGFECGIKIAGYDDVKVDDVIEAYRVEQVQRTLS